jgi:hypothetical protein
LRAVKSWQSSAKIGLKAAASVKRTIKACVRMIHTVLLSPRSARVLVRQKWEYLYHNSEVSN